MRLLRASENGGRRLLPKGNTWQLTKYSKNMAPPASVVREAAAKGAGVVFKLSKNKVGVSYCIIHSFGGFFSDGGSHSELRSWTVPAIFMGLR
jgi:hypothetical protein